MKFLNSKHISVETPTKFFSTFAKELKGVSQESITIVFIKDSKAVAASTALIKNGWLNILEDAIEIAEQNEADSSILIQHGERENQILPFINEMTDLSNGLIANGIWVMDSFLVESNNYFSYMCAGSDCCPPDGKAIDNPQPKGQIVFKDESRKAGAEAWSILINTLENSKDLDATLTGASLTKVAELLQDVQARDFVMANICLRSDIKDELVKIMIDCAKSASLENQPRIAGAAAASVIANEYSQYELDNLLELAKDDSLASLVRTAIASGLASTTIKKIFTESLIQMEKSVA